MTPHAHPIVVKKFGGSSVADVARIQAVAAHVVAAHRSGQRVVAVVSAMGSTTDELVRLAAAVTDSPDRREMDMLLTAGERITMSLLAMAIRDLGVAATSLTGSQSGLITNDQQGSARIIEVRPYRVEDALRAGHVVIVAGFQGVSYRREVTTLGRGGSDTTAVALAAALGAQCAEIYTDVDGVYTADPRTELSAQRLATLDYDTMLDLARAGARVVGAEAVAYARDQGIALYIRASDHREGETLVRIHAPEGPPQLCGVAVRREALVCDFGPEAAGFSRGSPDASGSLGGADSTNSRNAELDEILAAAGQTIVLQSTVHADQRGARHLWVARSPGDKSGDSHRAWLARLDAALPPTSRVYSGALVTAVWSGPILGHEPFAAVVAAARAVTDVLCSAQCGSSALLIVAEDAADSVVSALLSSFGTASDS